MVFVFAFSSCDSGSSSDDSPSAAYEIPADKYSAVENEDGIYFKFELPSEKIARCDVSIEGIGQIAELGFGEDAKTGTFFYPFVDAGKEYEVRFSFMKPEIQTDGFVLPQDDGLAYFNAKVTAGTKSKGEIKLSSKGEVAVLESGTEFSFLKKPEFTGAGKSAFESCGVLWYEEIGLVEGISWDHENRMTNWMTEIKIEQNKFETPLNLYKAGGINPKEHTIDFLCIRPKMQYECKNGETFTYQWDGFIYDINYPSQAIARSWQKLGSSDANKLYGTWICEYEDMEDVGPWNSDVESFIVKEKCRQTMTNEKDNTTGIYETEITKFDGSAFTAEEIKKYYPKLADKGSYTEDYSEEDGYFHVSEVKIIDDDKTIKVIVTSRYNDFLEDLLSEDEDMIVKISKDGKAFMCISYDDKYSVTETLYFKKQ